MIEEWCFQDVVAKYIPAGAKVKWDYLDAEKLAKDYKIEVPDSVNREQYIKAHFLANLVL